MSTRTVWNSLDDQKNVTHHWFRTWCNPTNLKALSCQTANIARIESAEERWLGSPHTNRYDRAAERSALLTERWEIFNLTKYSSFSERQTAWHSTAHRNCAPNIPSEACTFQASECVYGVCGMYFGLGDRDFRSLKHKTSDWPSSHYELRMNMFAYIIKLCV